MVTARGVIVLFMLALVSCSGIPRARTHCINDFRNDTDGVLSDADLATAWAHAQQTIAQGNWVINALDCSGPNIKCIFHAPDFRALEKRPDCFGVKGVHGTVYGGYYGVTNDSHNIAIDIDIGHDKAWAFASYEMENSLGIRLEFPMGNR